MRDREGRAGEEADEAAAAAVAVDEGEDEEQDGQAAAAALELSVPASGSGWMGLAGVTQRSNHLRTWNTQRKQQAGAKSAQMQRGPQAQRHLRDGSSIACVYLCLTFWRGLAP